MDSINTLSEFLLESGSQYRIFDMGRRVTPIDTSIFSDFEHVITPYPYPLQQHAFVAVVFWNPQHVLANDTPGNSSSNQHYVWFLKLPLDEKGLLEQASRSQFLDLVIQALGRSLEKTPNKEQQSALDHNPIIFKPSEQKLAAFTSQIKQVMKLPPSEFMSPALDYLQHSESHDKWQSVGYQGLCDITARISDPLFNQAITNALPSLPEESFCALCCALENVEVDNALAIKLLTILTTSINDNNFIKIIHAARALSSSKNNEIARHVFELLISYEAPSSELLDVLILMSGRYWTAMQESLSALMYLEKVAAADVEQDIFNQLFSDLVFIPSCREAVLFVYQTPNRSSKLTQYFTNFSTQ